MPLRSLATFLFACLVGCPALAADFSFIPLPAIDTDPNAGETYGVLPVLLFRDGEDRVRTIVAPSLTYNDFRGATGTFRYYTYPTPAERFDFEASYSQTIERRVNLHYRNLGLFADRFHADVQLLWDKDATVRFFGTGPDSVKQDETNMTIGVVGLYGTFGVNITPSARLSLGETIQRFDISRGAVPGLPYTADVFPALPGVHGTTLHAQRISLTYDDRDSFTTPTRGLSTNLFAEASLEILGSGTNYVKSGVEAVYLRPFWDAWMVLVVRGLLEALAGPSDTPFEVLPALGGASTLRGFSEKRFYGFGRVLLNVETRVRLFTLRLFGTEAEFQAAPFVDVGKVFNTLEQSVGGSLEVTPGIAFRGLVRPSVVGHLELGVSREGPAIFVGLDYPF